MRTYYNYNKICFRCEADKTKELNVLCEDCFEESPKLSGFEEGELAEERKEGRRPRKNETEETVGSLRRLLGKSLEKETGWDVMKRNSDILFGVMAEMTVWEKDSFLRCMKKYSAKVLNKGL